MNYSTVNNPIPEELKCCTSESSNIEVSMAENLSETLDKLLNINSMIEELYRYIFAIAEKENLDLPTPACMRDAIYQNLFLAELTESKLEQLVDRICV